MKAIPSRAFEHARDLLPVVRAARGAPMAAATAVMSASSDGGAFGGEASGATPASLRIFSRKAALPSTHA